MKKTLIAALPALMLGTTALAGPGDLLRVNADLVNLRAAPTDNATVRDRVEGGDEVLELRRDGGWYGVRVVETGQEGWIYGRLLDRVSGSELGIAAADSGFGELSQDFDHLIRQIEETVDIDMIEFVEDSGDTLTVTPTANWLISSSEQVQVLATAAVYQMWKNHQNNAPSTVVLLDTAGEAYVVIEDKNEAGPSITVIRDASGSDSQG